MLFKISEICCEITVKFPKFLRTHFVKSICEQLLLTLGQLLLSCFFKSYMTLEDLPNYYPQVFSIEAILKMTACFFQNWTSSLIVSEHFSQDLSLKKLLIFLMYSTMKLALVNHEFILCYSCVRSWTFNPSMTEADII